MSLGQQIITIAMVTLGTVITRFLPFFVFPPDKPTPEFIKYLGDVLPKAVIGMLVVYCIKDVNILAGNRGAPELIAVAAVVGFHLWKRNTLISIAGGTAVYMALLQMAFFSN